MRLVEEINIIFPREYNELRQVMLGNDATKNDQEALGIKISRHDLIKRMFKSPDWERLAPDFQKCVQLSIQRNVHPRTCDNLKKLFTKALQKQNSKHATVPHTQQDVSVVTKEPPQQQSVTTTTTACVEQRGTFPAETRYLRDMQQRTEELRANDFRLARAIAKQIKEEVDRDASMPKEDVDAYRTGRNLPGTTLDMTDIDSQYGLLRIGGCPSRREKASLLFHVALEAGDRLFVSMNPSNNGESEKFWENPVLKGLNIPGWKIENIKREELGTVLNENGERQADLVESTLCATSTEGESRQLYHLHYNGWQNHHPLPEGKKGEELFHLLQERISTICPTPTDRVCVNCQIGRDRSATVVATRLARGFIDAELKKGTSLEDIQINIPALIYKELRSRRPDTVRAGPHLTYVYANVSEYYTQLKAKKSGTDQGVMSTNAVDSPVIDHNVQSTPVLGSEVQKPGILQIPSETCTKMQHALRKILVGEPEAPQHTRLEGRNYVFKITDFPGYVFKVVKDGGRRLEEMKRAQNICDLYKLKRLIIPKAMLFDISLPEGTQLVHVEEELNYDRPSSLQEKKFQTIGKPLDKAIRQLAIFICHSSYTDVDYRNNPILNSSDGKVRIGLLDLEPMPYSDGIIGDKGKGMPRGLLNCVSEDHVSCVVEEVKNHKGTTLSEEDVRFARDLLTFYRKRNVSEGRELLPSPQIKFSSYPNFSEADQKKLQECAKMVVEEINDQLLKAPEEHTIRDKRFIKIPFHHSLHTFDIPLSADSNIKGSPFVYCETYFDVVYRALVLEGLVFNTRYSREHGFSFQV